MHFHFLSALVAKNLNRDHVQLWQKLPWLHNDSAPMTLFNSIYGPNEDSPDFYEQLFSIVSLSGDYLSWRLDLVLDFHKDTKFYSSIGNPRAREVVLEAMDIENLIDI